MEWIADRAAGGGFQIATDILGELADPSLYREMRLAPPSEPPMDPENEYLSEDVQLTQKAFTFGVHLASNILWGQLLYRYTLPLAAAALLSPEPAARKMFSAVFLFLQVLLLGLCCVLLGLVHQCKEKRVEAMRSLKRLVNVIVKAEDMLLAGPHLIYMAVADLAWPEETLARETMVRLLRAGFQDGNDECFELQRLLLRTFLGSASTKEVLESTFAHIRDVVARHVKNQKISPVAAWFYTIASPYSMLKTCGMDHCLPDRQAWVKWRSFYGRARVEKMKLYNEAANVQATSLPRGREIPRSAAGIKKTKWRLAGPLSHYKSSSALLYLLEDEASGFSNCHRAWAGVFLQCGQFFFHKDWGRT